MSEGRHATVLMSGGIDSAACAAFLLAKGLIVSALFVDHGQSAAVQERIAVQALAKILRIPIQEITLTGAKSFGVGELVGRNGFLVFSALLAAHGHPSLIGLGLHAGTPYYDCSPAFVDAIDRTVAEHTDNKVRVIAPFISWAKRDVYEYFIQAGLPVEYAYSCEAGVEHGCGICASCLDRKALQC